VFRRVLVANRGEIALRVMRTLEEMGIESVAVASEADRDAPHALAASETRVIGPAPASESYLEVEALIDAARKSSCDALHPGYGFLSESPSLAEACADAGITFIGPSPDAMRVMGSKTESRTAMARAGVPVVPGFQEAGADDGALARAAEALGYPVLVKAAAGGGGKGMRTVREPRDLASALALARSEARAAFGDERIYLERLIERPRHVEIQVFGDRDGNVFPIGERECSVQRRHQKILEETPSPAVDPHLRARMGEAAVAAARAVAYRNAGTVEFLLEESGDFHFLEMNTRLQVEHPVTEMVYGVDLVAAQVLTAAGEALPFDPHALAPRGHAVEARVYAEDPAQGFLPQIGRVARLSLPLRPGVRVDSGLAEGREVGVHYDPLLAKVIAWGPDRDQATDRLYGALGETVILGVTTNVDFLMDVLAHPAWRSGRLHTGFLGEHLSAWRGPEATPAEVVALAAEASVRVPGRSGNGAGAPSPTPWTTLGDWSPWGGR
jgi:acetyl-CoA carboxylase biotin carboxylase subunit